MRDVIKAVDGYVGAAERVCPICKLTPLMGHLRNSGIDEARTLLGTDVAVSALSDPHALISRRQLLCVFRNFLLLAPNVCPRALGASFRVTDYGFYGYALLSSPTIYDAISFAIRYQALAAPIVELGLVIQDQSATWQLRAYPEIAADPALHRFVIEYQIGILLGLHRYVAGAEFDFHSVQHAVQPTRSATGQGALASGCVTELHFDAAWLARPAIGANPLTYQLVEKICHEALGKLRAARGIIADIYDILLAQQERMPGMDELAATVGLHPRSLRRKIVGAGSSYQDIVDEVRYMLAIGYLWRTELRNEDISERLGFSDSSNFRRAFKRWTGETPNAFRQRSATL